MKLRSARFALAVGVFLSTMPAVAALSVAGGTAKNRVIVASGKERQRRIGSYYYLRNHPGGAYAAATKALSTPTSQSAYANICELRWKSLGLEIDLEVGSSSPCTATSLKKDWWYGTSITSPVWRTDRGLRVGDSLQHLKSLYPDASLRTRPRRWSLAAETKYGGLVFDLLEARVKAGRVTSFDLPADFLH